MCLKMSKRLFARYASEREVSALDTEMKKDTDMKKIKSKLVTIVTDNVLGIGIVENKTLLAACCRKER